MDAPLTIVIDSRIRIPLDRLSESAANELREEFTHDNPDFEKEKRRLKTGGFRRKGPPVPEKIRTWREEEGDLTLPRGRFARVREILAVYGIAFECVDNRTTGTGPRPVGYALAKHLIPAPFQNESADAAAKFQNCIVRAPTGCIAGDACVIIKRGDEERNMSLGRLVRAWHGQDGSLVEESWSCPTSTYVRAPFQDGSVRYAKILAAKYSGIKEVFRVILRRKNGGTNTIEATHDHRMLTPSGWVALSELSATTGEILVECGLGRLEPARIVSIWAAGERQTYDLEVEGAEAFMANGIAVHNSGKTLIAEMLAARLGVCTLVLVQTRELLNQWRRRLVAELGLREEDIGTIQGKRAKIRPINVVLVQTMAKHVAQHRDTFGAVIFDEVQRAAAKTFYPAVDGLRAKYRIGVSADERRKDRKDFLIYDVFGRVVADVDRKRLIADGFVLDTEIRMVPTNFRSEWYEGLAPSQRQDTDFNRLLAQMSADRERNLLIARLAVQETRAGHLLLVFSHRVEHCLGLRADIVADEPRCGVVVGDPELRRESEESIAGLGTGAIVAAVGTYQSIGTGVDLPAVDRGIAATPIHSNRPFVGQVRGRLCRVDRRIGATKRDSILYVLWDRHIHGLVPLRNYLRFNAGNVTVMDPETGALTNGRAFLKAAEAEEDASEARAQKEPF